MVRLRAQKLGASASCFMEQSEGLARARARFVDALQARRREVRKRRAIDVLLCRAKFEAMNRICIFRALCRNSARARVGPQSPARARLSLQQSQHATFGLRIDGSKS